MTLKARLDEVRAELLAPAPRLKNALAILDRIELEHASRPAPAAARVAETAKLSEQKKDGGVDKK